MAGGSSTFLAVLACITSAAGIHIQQDSSLRAFDGSKGCADLANQGTHFSVDVHVGTPPQKFSVVADTGSNTLIVPHCSCKQKGACVASRCFSDKKSSTFHLEMSKKKPVSMVLSYGSGDIEGMVAQESVNVGGVGGKLKDGLLLMTDNYLDFGGPFEGILGLGLPMEPTNWTLVEEQEKEQEKAQAEGGDSDIQDIIDQIFGEGSGYGGYSYYYGDGGTPQNVAEDMRKTLKKMRKLLKKAAANNTNHASGKKTMAKAKSVHRDAPIGFLEQTKNDRFSMCFNSGGDGVLRMGGHRLVEPLGGMGKEHWGVDFRGVSVGDAAADKVSFCVAKKHMPKDQKTPCGAIPDSGTTLMMGPSDQIGLLFEDICDNWPRCKGNYTKLMKGVKAADQAMKDNWGSNPFDMDLAGKADILQMLLADCSSWMGTDGLKAMPDLHFHIRSSDGKSTKALKIPANQYVLEYEGEDAFDAYKLLKGVGKFPMHAIATKRPHKTQKTCIPAFGEMDYGTTHNGPVWILGTALFYEYIVGYDMDTKPPSMSFLSQEEQPCGSCSGKAKVSRQQDDAAQYMPRRVAGRPRLPTVDTTKPL